MLNTIDIYSPAKFVSGKNVYVSNNCKPIEKPVKERERES